MYQDGLGGTSSQTFADTKAQRDDRFFLDWEFVVLKVEDRLFRIPKYQLTKKSLYFDRMFDRLQSKLHRAAAEGSSEANPIVLDNVTINEFHSFLELLLAEFGSNSASQDKQDHKFKALSILKLSNMWLCPDMRIAAIALLEPHIKNSIDKVLIGKREFVKDWVLDGFRTLIARTSKITDWEMSQIGAVTAFRLMCAREEFRNLNPPQSFGMPSYIIPSAPRNKSQSLLSLLSDNSNRGVDFEIMKALKEELDDIARKEEAWKSRTDQVKAPMEIL